MSFSLSCPLGSGEMPATKTISKMSARVSDLSATDVPLASIVIGPHGPFSELVFSLIEGLARIVGIETIRIDRFDIVDFSEAHQRILLCNYPSNQIVAAITRGDLKVLFLLESPTDTLLFMQRVLRIEPLEAIRSQSASAVANLAIGKCGNVSYLERSQRRSMLQLAADLVRTLGLGLVPMQYHALRESLFDGLGWEAGVEDLLLCRAARWPDENQAAPLGLVAAGRDWADVCHDVIDGSLAMARFGSPRPIVWPTEVFSVLASRLPGDPSAMALAGPSRNVYYGPYFYLPPSRYRVEVFVQFSADTTQVPFSLEVHAGAWLSRASIDQWRPGRFRGAFHLVHPDATSTVEIRLRNLGEITQGSLSLVEILFFAEQEEGPGL